MEGMDERLRELYPDMVGWRRHLHRHPELSYKEKATAAFIGERLAEWGIPFRSEVGGGGIVARIKGGAPGRVVALRADMDALPIQDEKNCDYASTVPGVMHACGHDAHTAALLGAAKLLQERREQLAGDVVLLFQHAEEVSPGGALPMIEDGALDGVDAIYGVHLWTPLPCGTAYARSGPVMAAADEFSVRIEGRGGHGGLPHETVDAIVTAANLVVQLQHIVSRQIDPVQPCVISIGSIHAGTGFNVIAEQCELIGTVRTFDLEVREQVVKRMEETVQHTCNLFGAKGAFVYKRGYPPVVNSGPETERFYRVGRRLFGENGCGPCPPLMAGEDFAYYLQKVPGCFMFVGAGSTSKGITAPHHHPRFDIDEEAIVHAARLLLHMALDDLAGAGRAGQ